MDRWMVALGSSLFLAATACGSTARPPPASPGVASMQAADFDTARTAREDARTTMAAEALVRQDYDAVLELTARPDTGPDGGWLDYDRGEALAALGRTDAAADAFVRAEARFGQTNDAASRPLAIWARARAFALAGRCVEARAAYDEYADAVRRDSRADAEIAAVMKSACVSR